MPASQLKRLKQSLRDSGVTGPQKSKKQKKQIASSKDQTRRNDRAAQLQNIRDSFNPFELKATNSRPQKFEHASASNGAGAGKYKAVLHRPGVSKSAGEEMRRATLLPEMRRRNKVGGLVDRRIGEGDADMTPEERAAARFAREKERKTKGRSMFDLEGDDDEGGFQLTHGGKGVGDLAADDFDVSVSGGSDDEGSDGGLFRKKRRRSDVDEEDDIDGEEEEQVEEQPERKKTKKEVMEELIAKSKMHKYERQKAKEDDEDLRETLDKGFDDIYALLKGSKKALPPPKQPEPAATNGSGPVINADRQRLLDGMDREKADKEYDIRMKQLATDARAKPSDKTLTAEEKALKDAQKLKVLEEKRQKRMRGEDVSDDEAAPKDSAAQLEGDDEEIPDQAEEFGFTNSMPKQKAERDVQPDEDEFEFDENLVASDSEAEMSDDESGITGDEDGDAAPAENEEDEFVKEVLGAASSTGANTSVLGERRSGKDASGLAYSYPCPRSHAELLEIVQELPAEKLTTVIQRVRALYHPSLSASNKESMADFSSALVEHLAWMAENVQPMAVIEQVIRHLHSLSRTYPTQIGEAFRRALTAFHERGQPTPGDLVQLTAISSIYPTSDHWHQVVTPAITIMARWLSLNVPSTAKPADGKVFRTGAFLVALCVKYQALSRRYIPEALRFTIRTLAAGTAKLSDPISAKLVQPDIVRDLLKPHLNNLAAMADMWKDKSAFVEIFSPALPILKKLGQSPLLKDLNAKTPHRNISILIQQSRTARRPLELHHHRPQPIRTSIPKFEENFNPDKHYDPDKERSEASKLQKEYKRERKGALRELRKDANFVAREQLKDKRERDAEYEKKYRRLVAEVQNEEGAANRDYERVKAKRQAEKKRDKK
ncbi:Putative nucleolar protein [Septoria linicola]|uniref:Nucleolar protein n=1 Tax=Septoria linicola TaxID=215465 RepID=A0A9Q9AY61_9PEZI|nr:Putative nucleolar protein [Septoria linicola]